MIFKPMAMALVHYPVLDRRGDVVSSAVTNLDIHDLARLATTYSLSRYYLVTPAVEQQTLACRIVEHWQKGAGASYNPDRCQALDCLRVMSSLDEALVDWRALAGPESLAVLTGARHQDGIDYPQASALAAEHPVMLVFGTGHGLAPEIYTADRPCLAPIRAGQYNHLSVRTAAAITIDRLIGECGEVMPLPPR
ncbi:MAG: RNA methyltransferase [Desulfuromonadales bacterium]|nr:RNA methyltransferase [Desulfuromonadales bacterium]